MSEFWLYLKLGLEHVLDWKAYDHILFLVALCTPYTISSWKRLLVLVSLFTLGHTASLLLAGYQVVSVSSAWIEFLIPITIFIAAMFNIFGAGRRGTSEKIGLLYLVTIFFGLIHGFGFASYYEFINDEGGALPLVAFALGIELSQVIIVFVVLILAFIFQSIFRFNKRDWALVISSIVIGMVIPMLIENWIF